MSNSFEEAYDPETFRARGHALVDQLADHFASMRRGEGPVMAWSSPDVRLREWSDDFQKTDEDFGALVARLIRDSMHVHHPHYIGHQMAVPLPLTALGNLAVSALNNSTAIYEMGPALILIERAVLGWMTKLFGLGPNASGVFTSGGTLGNLTALLAARQRQSGGQAWDLGNPESPEAPTVLVSGQAHYSVERATRIMGLGTGGAHALPVDENFRLRVDQLEASKREVEKKGRKVIAVVASVCTTATGAFDALEPIADFCEKYGLWLHADGAHGAASILSPKYRHLLKAIERVDSLVWDPHKMMMMPALTSAVLFRDQTASCQAFAQEASFLFQKGAEEEWYNPCHRTLECTKRDFTFRLYSTLKMYGPQLFADYVTRMYDRGTELASLVRKSTDFELAVEPECNIVCFRHLPSGVADPDRLQAEIRQRMLARGHYYVVQARLPKGLHLRVTVMNPFTSEKDLAGLLDEVRACAAEVGVRK